MLPFFIYQSHRKTKHTLKDTERQKKERFIFHDGKYKKRIKALKKALK